MLAEIAKYDTQSSNANDGLDSEGSDTGGADSDVDGGQRDWWRSWWPSTGYPRPFRVQTLFDMK